MSKFLQKYGFGKFAFRKYTLEKYTFQKYALTYTGAYWTNVVCGYQNQGKIYHMNILHVRGGINKKKLVFFGKTPKS